MILFLFYVQHLEHSGYIADIELYIGNALLLETCFWIYNIVFCMYACMKCDFKNAL